jgi:steroid delta-isomerase-like uncharacterized protein
MRTEENKKIVREYIENIINTGNVDRIDSYISEDFTEVRNTIPEKIGVEEAKKRVLGYRNTYPDFKVTVDRQIAEGDWVATCCTVSGTHLGEWLNIKPTGKKVSYTGVVIDKLEDGRIVEHGGAVNLFDAFYELGIIKVS